MLFAVGIKFLVKESCLVLTQDFLALEKMWKIRFRSLSSVYKNTVVTELFNVHYGFTIKHGIAQLLLL